MGNLRWPCAQKTPSYDLRSRRGKSHKSHGIKGVSPMCWIFHKWHVTSVPICGTIRKRKTPGGRYEPPAPDVDEPGRLAVFLACLTPGIQPHKRGYRIVEIEL